MQKIALIPAYQPPVCLLDLLQELREQNFFCLVVDDGSGGEFRELFKAASENAKILTHEENRGKGAALRTGLRWILEHCPAGTVTVTVDADGQHQVKDVVRVCEEASVHPECLVLGSRAFQGKVPLRSQFGNAVTRKVFSVSTGVTVQDTQTGLRAFATALIPRMLAIGGDRYEYEMNVLLECTRNSIPIREVETATVYLNQNASSHFSTLRDSARIYREILKFAASSLTGFAVDYSLYSLLVILTAELGTFSVPLSNLFARIVSASVNFTINKKLVFRSENRTPCAAGQYFLLAGGILLGNTLLLSWMVNGLGVNRFAGKIVTELIFFTISWLAQKCWIFKKPEESQ